MVFGGHTSRHSDGQCFDEKERKRAALQEIFVPNIHFFLSELLSMELMSVPTEYLATITKH